MLSALNGTQTCLCFFQSFPRRWLSYARGTADGRRRTLALSRAIPRRVAAGAELERNTRLRACCASLLVQRVHSASPFALPLLHDRSHFWATLDEERVWGDPALVRDVEARAELQQHLDRVDGLVLERAHERHAAKDVLCIGARAVFEEDTCDVCARECHASVV